LAAPLNHFQVKIDLSIICLYQTTNQENAKQRTVSGKRERQWRKRLQLKWRQVPKRPRHPLALVAGNCSKEKKGPMKREREKEEANR
jgi:hypothetical protein